MVRAAFSRQNPSYSLADMQILARIVKNTVQEVKELPIEKIMECIGEPVVTLQVPELLCMKIKSVGTEDIEEEDGKIIYDIRFPLYYKEKTLKILINIEAQKSIQFSKLRYHIENRMTYYLARMISSQKNSEFSNSDYDQIKPIYSIWICMDTNQEEDSIIEISMKPEVVFGKSEWRPQLNLMKGVVIRIRESENMEQSKNELIAMLELLFSRTSKKEKKQRLEQEYDLKMTTELEEGVNDMCNLSDVFEEQIREEVTAEVTQKIYLTQVLKKVMRGKGLDVIAEEMEESPDFIKPFYEAVLNAAPEYDMDQIYKNLQHQ